MGELPLICCCEPICTGTFAHLGYPLTSWLPIWEYLLNLAKGEATQLRTTFPPTFPAFPKLLPLAGCS